MFGFLLNVVGYLLFDIIVILVLLLSVIFMVIMICLHSKMDIFDTK